MIDTGLYKDKFADDNIRPDKEDEYDCWDIGRIKMQAHDDWVEKRAWTCLRKLIEIYEEQSIELKQIYQRFTI